MPPFEGLGTMSLTSSWPPFRDIEDCADWFADWGADGGVISISLRASAVSGIYPVDDELGGVTLADTGAFGSKPMPSYTIVGGLPSFHPCTFHSAFCAALIIEFGTYLSHL